MLHVIFLTLLRALEINIDLRHVNHIRYYYYYYYYYYGFRPGHLKDLISCQEISDRLLDALTDFVNLMLSGCCPVQVQPVFFGGRLIALAKRDGGIRPIAVGMVWRRLVAKCAAAHATAVKTHTPPDPTRRGSKRGRRSCSTCHQTIPRQHAA